MKKHLSFILSIVMMLAMMLPVTVTAAEEMEIPSETCDHEWSEWDVTKKATVFKKGAKERECFVCGTIQTKSIKKLKAFAKFKKKNYKVKRGKSLSLKNKVKKGRGDSIKKWRVSNKKVATISKSGRLKAKRSGKVKVTVVLKSKKKATCTVVVKASKSSKKKRGSSRSGTVYWTPSGKVYHVSRHCPTLSRSRRVLSGSIKQSHKSRCCKVCG